MTLDITADLRRSRSLWPKPGRTYGTVTEDDDDPTERLVSMAWTGISCPACGAEINEFCRTRKGHTTNPHKVRRDLAEAVRSSEPARRKR
ncbi:MAG: hypothetical protein AAGH15_10965 [Myxococcota bacterium]